MSNKNFNFKTRIFFINSFIRPQTILLLDRKSKSGINLIWLNVKYLRYQRYEKY